MKLFLHAGSGKKTYREIPVLFDPSIWKEVRYDVDPAVSPDIVGSLIDMKQFPDNHFDAVFTSHTIEHLYPMEVRDALLECKRVLKPEGFFLVTCPDLEIVSQRIVEGKLLDVMYESPEGPVTPLDMLYGFRPQLSRTADYMAHHTGFTLPVLLSSLRSIGFQTVTGKKRAKDFDLWALATKSAVSEQELNNLKTNFFPQG
ncbi:MAG: Methyltransferase type 11 [Candidatus Paceibacter sp.]|jgi:SAM-dependent methyltransferase|nr:Methyltransferase type 11 [Candidatus Paceibacter sp.]